MGQEKTKELNNRRLQLGHRSIAFLIYVYRRRWSSNTGITYAIRTM